MAACAHLRRMLLLVCLCAGNALRAEEAKARRGEAEPEVRPGAEFSLYWAPVGRDLPVYVPSDYSRGQRWPVVVLYHGLHGEPTTQLFRDLTEGQGVIVVGMEYLERELVRRSAEEQKAYQARERAQLEALLRALAERLRLDRSRVYLAGISQGGWQVSAFAESAEPRVAGYVILLAGRFPRAETNRPDLSDRAVYVGTGETDETNVYARMAAQYFGRCGAEVTWEEYAGRGHQLDAAAPRLRAWVAMRLGREGDSRQREANAWVAEGLAKAKHNADPVACYAALQEVVDDPRSRTCDAALRAELLAGVEQVRMSPEVQSVWQAQHVYERALWQEQTARSLQDLEAALEVYRQAVKRYGKTPYGRLAEREVGRVEGNVEQARSRQRPRPTGPPRVRFQSH